MFGCLHKLNREAAGISSSPADSTETATFYQVAAPGSDHTEAVTNRREVLWNDCQMHMRTNGVSLKLLFPEGGVKVNSHDRYGFEYVVDDGTNLIYRTYHFSLAQSCSLAGADSICAKRVIGGIQFSACTNSEIGMDTALKSAVYWFQYQGLCFKVCMELRSVADRDGLTQYDEIKERERFELMLSTLTID